MGKPNKTGRYGKGHRLNTGMFADEYLQEVLSSAWRLGGSKGALEICAEEGWDFDKEQLKRAAMRYGWKKQDRYDIPRKYDDIVYETIEKYYPKGGSPMVIEELKKLGHTGHGKSFIGGIAYQLGLNSPLLHKANKGCIKKGNVPPNKGKKMSAETYEKVKHTFFQKGQKSHTELYDGAIRIRSDLRGGRFYLYMRLGKAKWKELHRLVWETANGPIPPKHVVRFASGEDRPWHPGNGLLEEVIKRELDQSFLDDIEYADMLDHLELITMKENARLNHNPEKARQTHMSYTDKVVIGRFFRHKEYQEILKQNPQLVELHRNIMKLRKHLNGEQPQQDGDCNNNPVPGSGRTEGQGKPSETLRAAE